MSGGLLLFARMAVFLVVFILVANIARVLLGARIGILPYHVHIFGAAVFATLALISGRFFKLSKPNLAMLMWFATLMLVMFISLLLVSSDEAAQGTFKNITRFVLMGATFTILMQNRELLSAGGYGALAAVVFSMVVTFVEFSNPDFRIIRDVMFVTDADRLGPQRIAGLHADPNANGTLMVLGMFATQFLLPRSLRFVFAMAIGGAVLTTASRGSLTLWLLVVFTSFWIGAYSAGRLFPKILAFATAVGFTLLLTTGQVPQIISSLGLDEYTNKSMVERLSGGFFDQEDRSTQARILAASENFEKFTDHPIIGIGLGASMGDEFTLGSHNMLLRMASELGIFGVLTYLSLLIIPLVVKSKEGFLFVVFFYISNMFTHTSFEKSTFAILVPFSVLFFVVQQPIWKRRQRRQKRQRSRSLYEPFSG